MGKDQKQKGNRRKLMALRPINGLSKFMKILNVVIFSENKKQKQPNVLGKCENMQI